jgi:hypothetical protein
MKQLQFFEKNNTLKAAKQEIDSLFKKPFLGYIRFCLLLTLFTWIVWGVFYSFLPPIVPLFFSRPWGEEQLVIKEYTLILPSVSTLLLLINIRLSSLALLSDKLLTYILLWGQIIVNALAFFIITRLVILLA